MATYQNLIVHNPGTYNVGAPNSIARYASNCSWGANEWAVFEYVNGQGDPVLRAAGSKIGCQAYMNADRILVDIRPYKEFYNRSAEARAVAAGRNRLGW